MILGYPKQFCLDLYALNKRASVVGWKASLEEIVRPDVAGAWQLTKYLLIGGLSVFIFYAAYGVFRASVEWLSEGSFTRSRLIWNMFGICVAFIPTNYFTYWTNKRWVFVGGRHERQKEFFLFTLGAALSFLVSQGVVFLLIQDGRLNDFVITLSVIVCSTLTNFFFRKFLVFHN
jgi:putative flippase GtrA